MAADTVSAMVPDTITRQSLSDLGSAIEAASTAGVLVLKSQASDAAGAVFCRGLDFSEFAALSDQDLLSGLCEFARILCRLRTGPFTSIAVVGGDAIGGGVGIAAACDIVIATEAARFGLPEALYGIAPAIVATVLRDRISRQALRLLSLRCETIDAREAIRIGLVDRLSSGGEIERDVGHEVRRMSRLNADGRKAVKSLLLNASELERAAQDAARLTYTWLTDGAVRERIRNAADGEPPWVG